MWQLGGTIQVSLKTMPVWWLAALLTAACLPPPLELQTMTEKRAVVTHSTLAPGKTAGYIALAVRGPWRQESSLARHRINPRHPFY